MTNVSPARRFAVALSYPSERREFVASVAAGLAEMFSPERILYDRFHEAEFARPDLDVYLPELYRKDAELVVIFLAAEYAAKRWTRLEWRHVRQLIGTLQSDRIMFISFGDPGDTASLGILPGDGYFDASGRTPSAIVDAIAQRVRLRSGDHGHPAIPAGVTARPPFQSPPLPASFVLRKPIGELIEQVLSSKGEGVGLAITAIHGAPGVGKTIAASAIAHDGAIRQRYSDGILWVTLGQNPDIAQQIGSLVQTFGESGETATNLSAAQGILRAELSRRRVLLVLDDVWHAQHAVPFIAGDAHSHVIVTTRRASVADDLGAVLHELGMMTEEDGLSLLRARFELTRRHVDDAELRAIAESAGNHPLAMDLLAALLLRGYDTTTARRQLGGQRRRGTQSRLSACIDLSLQWLHSHDSASWHSFLLLGILRQNSPVSAAAAGILWDRPVPVASELLNQLADDGLLQRGVGVFLLHDLLRNAALDGLQSALPDGLGLTTEAAHAALLERYKRLATHGTWSSVPDDGYIHPNLVHHMIEANQRGAVHDLFAETSKGGAHGWFTARRQLGQTPGFFEDLRSAAQSVSGEDPARVARHFRYALIQSSVDSALDRAPAVMPAILLERGVWSPFRAIYTALRINERNRGEALGLVTNTLILQGESGSPEFALAASEMRKIAESNSVSAVCCVVLGRDGAPEDREFYVGRAAACERDPTRLLWLSRLLDGAARDLLHDRACELLEKLDDPVQRVSRIGAVLFEARGPIRAKWVARVAEWLNNSVGQRKRSQPRAPSAPDGPRSLALVEFLPETPKGRGRRPGKPTGRGRRWLRLIVQEVFRWPFDFDVALFGKTLAQLGAVERQDLLQARPAPRPLTQPLALTPAEAIQASLSGISSRLAHPALDHALELLPYCRPAARQELGDLAFGRLTAIHDDTGVSERGSDLELLLPYVSDGVRTSILEKLEAGLYGERFLATVRRYRAAEAGHIDDADLSHWWDIGGTSLSGLMRVMAPPSAERIGSIVAIGDAPERTAAVVALSAYGSMASVSAALGDQIPGMIALVNELSHALGAGTVSDVVHAAARSHSEWWIVEALTLTVWKVATPSELETIAQAQHRLRAPDLQARLVERVCQRMCDLGLLEHIAPTVRGVGLLPERWRIAAELAGSIAERGATALALQLADEITDAAYRSKARAAIALALAHTGAVSEARALSIDDPDWRDWRDRLINQVSDHFGPALRLSRPTPVTNSARLYEFASITRGAREAATSVPSASGLAAVWEAADEQNDEALTRAVDALWTSDAGGLSYIQRLGLLPRSTLMRVIRDCAPVIAYGRSANADEVIEVVGSVGRWWP